MKVETTEPKIRIPQDILEAIAARHLEIETLDVRKRDFLDFREVSVWSLKDALEAAYQAGHQSINCNDYHELQVAVKELLDARDNQMLTASEWQLLKRAARRSAKKSYVLKNHSAKKVS